METITSIANVVCLIWWSDNDVKTFTYKKVLSRYLCDLVEVPANGFYLLQDCKTNN